LIYILKQVFKYDLKKDYTVRPYRQGDEEDIVQLLQLVFNGWPHLDLKCSSLDFWRWKYQDKVLDRKIISVAEINNKIIGSTHPRLLKIKMFDKIVLCSLGGDVAVHLDFRNIGVWKNLREFSNEAKKKAGVQYSYLVTGNPIVIKAFMRSKNYNLFPTSLVNLVRIKDIDQQLQMMPAKNSSLKKLGFHAAKILNDISNTIHGSESVKQDLTIAETDNFDERINGFWEEVSNQYDFIVERRRDYLNWRYCDPRCGDFIIKIAEYEGQILGYSVLRINRFLIDYPVGYIVDLLTLSNRPDVSEALAADAISYFDNNDVNIINYQVVKGHPYERILKKQGFLNSRIKIHLFYNPLGNKDEIRKLKTSPENRIYVSWADHDVLPVRIPT